ncbi:hypothetical protein [Natribacillus halophilus]|uniref:Uncharacterized protein n=1 Tax=Natribacillus halophilus TaxID=549003 RepID=A0A1G8R350_9BACI|nr:hypothetical protein [Natribacillus halophilus]SDJ11396.1 hypothetical protein SAMN04488123_11536 [Natribacillus halophilus]
MNKKLLYGALSGIFAVGMLAACNGEMEDGDDGMDDGGEEMDEGMDDEEEDL